MTPHEDRAGVFVPFWMIAETPNLAAAVYLAQVTWLWQPSLRGQDRAEFVERKTGRWLVLKDAVAAEMLGVSDDTVYRLRRALVKAGLIEATSGKVGGVRSTLVRPNAEVLQRRSNGDPVTAPARNSVSASARNSYDRTSAEPFPLVEIDTEKKENSASASARDVAGEVVSAWWEWRNAKGEPPVQSFIAVVKIVEQALRQGVTVGDVKRALALTPTVTAAALEMSLSKLRGKVGRPPPDVAPEVAAQIVADYERNGRGPRAATGSPLPLGP